MKKYIKLFGLFICCLSLLVCGLYYWHRLSYYPSTDNAYVQGNIIHIAPNVSGTIAKVWVQDNQIVKKGEHLYSLDKRPFEIALNQAKAKLALAKQHQKANLAASETAKANVEQAKAKVILETKHTHRIKTLEKQGRASIAEGDNASTQLAVAKAQLKRAQSQYQQSLANLGENHRSAELQSAIVGVEKASLNLNYADINAPAEGQITHFDLQPGDYAINGQSNLTLVENHGYWIQANFKETQLERIQPNQLVDITLDMSPGLHYQGKVASLSAGTGTVFSLLPVENATGNWVKVTQRVPVKITILPGRNQPQPKVGASALVTVNTKTHG